MSFMKNIIHKKQKPIRPISQEKDDNEKYGTSIPCSLNPPTYTSLTTQPALMGTMLQHEQRVKKKMGGGFGSYKILDQIENI